MLFELHQDETFCCKLDNSVIMFLSMIEPYIPSILNEWFGCRTSSMFKCLL